VTAPGARTTVVACRPRFEGANIRTWIGFRQLVLLVEEAVLQWFRERGAGPARLYHEHGLGLEIVDSTALLPATLDVDDQVIAEVSEERPGRFRVTLAVERENGRTLVLRGRAAVALVRQPEAAPARPLVGELAPLVIDDIAATAPPGLRRDAVLASGEDAGAALATPGAFVWSWRAPYSSCHFSDRVQHSGFVRALEEVVDRFLADRGLSVGAVLRARGWIPVVSRARVQMLAAAYMEETIHTVFAVREILRAAAFDARMDCFVRRGDRLVHVAAASILHGYAWASGPAAGGLVDLDAATCAALAGPGR
jgi:acyl-CoA thioesterase FadM